jgi:predicted MFS family arabinose efflux permease
MRATVLPLYALVFLETLTWIAMIPLAPTFADELSLGEVQTGMILSAGSLTALVVAVPLGVLADRLGARRVTLVSAVIFTLAAFGQGFADTFWSLLLARGLFGVAFGALWSAGTAWLSDAISDTRRARALAAMTPVSGVGFTVGPVFAGVLADHLSTGAPFLIVGCVAVLVTLSLFFMGPVVEGEVPRQRLRETVRRVGGNELVLGGLAIIVLIGLVGGGVNLLVPLGLRDNGVSASEIGLLFAGASALYTVGSAIITRIGSRAVALRVGGSSALLSGITIALVLLSDSTVAAVCFILVRAPIWSVMDTIIFPLGAAGAHRSALGSGAVMGLLTVGWAGASTVGPILTGVVADAAGTAVAYAMLIALSALCGSWLLYAGRSGSRRVTLDTAVP